MMAFWLSAAALTVAAVAFLLVPLWRERKSGRNVAVTTPLAVLAVIPVSIALYLVVTTFDPDAPTAAAGSEDLAMLEELARRLSEEPENIEGWILLGRSYRSLGDYQRARMAFEQAWNRTADPSDTLKLLYAESMLFTEQGSAFGMAGDLVEDVLGRMPNDQMALFYGALVATERNRTELAVERYGQLLATNPPREIVAIIEEQLMALTGEAAPLSADAARAAEPVIELEVSVADNIDLSRFGPNARVFVLAREPGQRMPIAVTPHPLSALPGRFALSDADVMGGLAGTRPLSEYESVAVVVRISASGMAAEQAGDVYAEAIVEPGSGETVSLLIDQVVPGA